MIFCTYKKSLFAFVSDLFDSLDGCLLVVKPRIEDRGLRK